MDNTDDQLVELRKFWEEYGRSIVVGVLLAVVSFGSWNFWDRYKTSQAEQASTIYYTMMDSYKELEKAMAQEKQQASTGNDQALKKKNETLAKLSKFQESVNSLKEQYANTEYAHYAGLQNAKYFVSQNDLASAETELRSVLKSNPNKSIQLLTQLRLARVLLALEKYDEALKLTDIKTTDSYTAAFEELKGDIYLQQGKSDLALAAYSKAKDATEEASEDLKMKYYNLLAK